MHGSLLNVALLFAVSFFSFSTLCSLMISLGSLCLYCWMNTKDGWESRWVKSDWKKDEDVAGEWNYTAGKWHGDPNDKGTLLNCIMFVYMYCYNMLAFSM